MKPPHWEIWSEGYHDNAGHCGAVYLGCYPGKTFKDACSAWATTLDTADQQRFFNPDKLTFWGCRLFNTEAEARKRFG